MTSVEATCPSCGGVWILPDEIVVRVCVDFQSSAYTFRCPECGQRAVKPATDRIVDLLTSVGASLEVWCLPDELREPHPGGPPISHDDLLDFHLLLQDRGWFGRLEELVAGAGGQVRTVRRESRRGGSSPSPGDWRSRPFRRGPRSGP